MKEFINYTRPQKAQIDTETRGFGASARKLRHNVLPSLSRENDGQYRDQYGKRRKVRGIRKSDGFNHSTPDADSFAGQSTTRNVNHNKGQPSRHQRRHNDPLYQGQLKTDRTPTVSVYQTQKNDVKSSYIIEQAKPDIIKLNNTSNPNGPLHEKASALYNKTLRSGAITNENGSKKFDMIV